MSAKLRNVSNTMKCVSKFNYNIIMPGSMDGGDISSWFLVLRYWFLVVGSLKKAGHTLFLVTGSRKTSGIKLDYS